MFVGRNLTDFVEVFEGFSGRLFHAWEEAVEREPGTSRVAVPFQSLPGVPITAGSGLDK